MKRQMTRNEIKNEVKYVAEHLEEMKQRQCAERDAYFDDPVNARQIALARQHLAIAEQLYRARKKAGFTQAALARRMNVSQPMIAKLERGKVNVSFDTLLKYAAACGCEVTITLS